MLRERNKKKQEKFYRGPRLECERWLWWLELGDGVPFAPGGDPAGKTMSRFDRGGETDPDDLWRSSSTADGGERLAMGGSIPGAPGPVG